MKRRFDLKYADYETSALGKKAYNEELFKEVAPKYVWTTRLLSFNHDQNWKRRLVALIDRGDVHRCLDLACGDGDITLMLAERFPKARITGLDLTEAMLDLARRRTHSPNVEWIRGDMCATGLPDECVDVVTGGYALRNAPDVRRAVVETYRVLKPGGQGLFLDFAKSDSRLRQRLNGFLLSFWGSLWGLILHRRAEVYNYIAKSLKHFPARSEFHRMIEAAGFRGVRYESRLLGLMEITVFTKPGKR